MARWVGVGIQQPRSGVEPATSRSQVPHRTTGPPRISETPVCVGVCVCEKSAVRNTASYNQKQKPCNLQPFWCRGVSRGWHDTMTAWPAAPWPGSVGAVPPSTDQSFCTVVKQWLLQLQGFCLWLYDAVFLTADFLHTLTFPLGNTKLSTQQQSW